MIYASNFRGKIPLELYIDLQNKFPQLDGENDTAWLQRIKRDPTLAKKMFGTPEFKTELIQAVHRRAMAQAGARRTGNEKHGPGLIKLTRPGDSNAKTDMAQRYKDEFMIGNEGQYKYATEAYELLLEQFDAFTPPGGSIFWNGINELALAKLVDQWNSELGNEIYGQLEATTSARYVNKMFTWEVGGVFQKYFQEVSGRLGHAATGHVTAVVRCGLRHDSIFTLTELPRMMKLMDEKLGKKAPAGMTDLTIIVIEPKHLPKASIASFTNNGITAVPIVRPNTATGRINGRDDCDVDGQIAIPFRVREYWTMQRGRVGDSHSAAKIKADFAKLIRWP